MPILDPLNRITAKEAYELYQTSYERKQARELKNAYSAIRDAATYQTHLITVIDGYDLADYVFNQLKRDNYLVKMEAVSSNCDNHRYRLTVSWAGEAQIGPNKKYILPMEDSIITNTYGEKVQRCAFINKFGAWDCESFFPEKPNLVVAVPNYFVTAKDLEDAPEWVKAIEPVELEE